MNKASEAYLQLIQRLVRKNQLSSGALEMIAQSSSPCDPYELASGVSRQELLAFSKTYKVLVRQGLVWRDIQDRLTAMIPEVLKQLELRNDAKIETAPLDALKTVGALWCGLFDHPGRFAHIRVPDLRFAYRGPSLFLSIIRQRGSQIAFLIADEDMSDACFPLPPKAGQEAALVYLCTHGKCPASGYEAYLNRGTWKPGKTRFNKELPIVMVLDTCNLIEGAHGWETGWANALRGGSVRLLLGFMGLTSIDPGSSLRGKAFAENLVSQKKMSYADAWIDAVRTQAVTENRHAIAIGVGDSPADAEEMLHLTLDGTSSIPRPKRLCPGPIFFAVKDLHETQVSTAS